MKRPRRGRFKNAVGRSDRTSESQLPIALELSRAASSGSLFANGIELARAAADREQTVVLVEGISDQLALNALGRRLGWDAQTEGIAIVAMGGATNIGHFLDLLGPPGVRIAGLCDRGEEHRFQRALERAGFGVNLTRSEMEALGFYVCDADLEDELIRAVGVDAVLNVVATQDELEAFRTFQRQHAWQEQSGEAQLRRWLGVKTLRKFRYATLLVEALDLDRIPKPLARLLAHVRDGRRPEESSIALKAKQMAGPRSAKTAPDFTENQVGGRAEPHSNPQCEWQSNELRDMTAGTASSSRIGADSDS